MSNSKRTLEALADGLSPAALEILRCFQNAPQPCHKHSSYFETYAQLLRAYRGKPITFVEIGVFGGGSLFMWRDYLGPQARIIGVDLNPEAARWRSQGFEIHIGNQSDAGFWSRFFEQVGPVDVLLDDGGHTYEQQIRTVHDCLPHIRNGGCLIVEDTHTSYLRAFGYPSRFTFTEWIKGRVDRINGRSSLVETGDRRYEDVVHSLQVFESIVALMVDRERCERSYPVTNGREQRRPEDYRFKEYEASWLLSPRLRKTRLGRKLLSSLAKRISRSRLRRLRRFF